MTRSGYFCTDCDVDRMPRPDGRCSMCGGARMIGYNPPVQCGASRCRDLGCFGMCSPPIVEAPAILPHDRETP